MLHSLLIVVGVSGLLLIWRMGWLTASATMVAGLYGASLAIWGGWSWVIPLLVFFISSSLLSFSKARPTSTHDPRTSVQVLANGGVPWLMIIGYAVWPSELWYLAFLGATAAATSDTWSTEIGLLSNTPPIDLRTWEPTVAGLSGAVTMMGLAGGLTGALLMGFVAMVFLGDVMSLMIVAVSGFVGAIVDSVLGATVQAGYRTEGGHWTENPDKGELRRGWSSMSNDAVNVGCTLTGSVLAAGFVWML